MPITREEKAVRLAEITDLLSRQEVVVFVNYSGLAAKTADEVRRAIEASNAKYLVTKNTLLRLALKNAGVEGESAALDQPMAAVFGFTDMVGTAKAIVKAAKQFEALEIVGGVVEGQLVDEATIRELATLPSREELLARLVGAIASPMSGLVSVLSGNLRGLVSVIHQYEQKKANA